MEKGQIQKIYDRLGEIETLLAQTKADLRDLLDAVTTEPESIVPHVGMHPGASETSDSGPESTAITDAPGCIPTSDEALSALSSQPSAYYTADEDEPDAVEILEEEEDEAHDPGVEGKHPDLSFITINERVRYRQNLFGGSKELFDEAMALLQSLTSYADARRYLIDDLEWNPADDEIQAEFLEKLYLCFKEAR